MQRVGKIKQGHPLDPTTMIGAQASNDQLEKILSYIDIGKQEGRPGSDRRRAQCQLTASCAMAIMSSRRCSKATTRCASSRRRFSARLLSVTTFEDDEEALAIANDTLYGLGAGVWTRRSHTRLSLRPRHPSRTRLDQLLPRLSGARGVRRLQAIGHSAAKTIR